VDSSGVVVDLTGLDIDILRDDVVGIDSAALIGIEGVGIEGKVAILDAEVLVVAAQGNSTGEVHGLIGDPEAVQHEVASGFEGQGIVVVNGISATIDPGIFCTRDGECVVQGVWHIAQLLVDEVHSSLQPQGGGSRDASDHQSVQSAGQSAVCSSTADRYGALHGWGILDGSGTDIWGSRDHVQVYIRMHIGRQSLASQILAASVAKTVWQGVRKDAIQIAKLSLDQLRRAIVHAVDLAQILEAVVIGVVVEAKRRTLAQIEG